MRPTLGEVSESRRHSYPRRRHSCVAGFGLLNELHEACWYRPAPSYLTAAAVLVLVVQVLLFQRTRVRTLPAIRRWRKCAAQCPNLRQRPGLTIFPPVF